MNNNRQCPVCRSLLTTSNCKKCGYQQKKLKIVETQQEFGRFNFINRIQRSYSSHKTGRRVTGQEKLKLYLRQYIKLLKSSASKVAVALSLSLQHSQRLNETIFQIWKGYLVRRHQLGLSIAGMFKRYISSRTKPPSNATAGRKRKKANTADIVVEKSEKDLDSSEEEKQEGVKRKANAEKIISSAAVESQLQAKHKFRSYYIVTVKPLIQESIQQRKIDKSSLTNCQMSFLSYILGAGEVDEELVSLCSHKYLKMLLKLKIKQKEGSYVKDREIQEQLRLRNCRMVEKKDDCVLLILLIDLLLCFDQRSFQVTSNQTVADLLSLYQKSQAKSDAIDTIVGIFSKPTAPQNPSIPQVTFQLIYTIISLAVAKMGLCITISEVVMICGQLQILPIKLQEEILVEGVSNQEAISANKIRKNCHLLASFLQIEGEVFLNKWCEKWSNKFQIQTDSAKMAVVNHIIFKQLMQSEQHGDAKGEFMAQNKLVKYRRHLWLEQDIASLAGIVIYLKLATGITTYPYLVNFPIKEIAQTKTIDDEQIVALTQLLQNKNIKVSNATSRLIKSMAMPEEYVHQISLSAITKTISIISAKDKAFQSSSFNKAFIRFRNLAHLNGLSANDMITKFTHIKETHFQSQKANQHQIQLKYEETLHKQFTRELADRYKKLRHKKGKIVLPKATAKPHLNIQNQMGCILRENETLGGEGDPEITEECKIDEPSANYELMYEYNLENLSLSNRKEQLYLMEQLCFNLCTFSELTYWLNREEYVLKFFEA